MGTLCRLALKRTAQVLTTEIISTLFDWRSTITTLNCCTDLNLVKYFHFLLSRYLQVKRVAALGGSIAN
jgi:hypothetical protein